MGMDIYGLNPKLVGEKPEINWTNVTPEDREVYLQKIHEFEDNNPGYYFRANVWAWRPMAEIILACSQTYKLDLPQELVDNIHSNSGAGLKTQDECTVLANFMDSYITLKFNDWEYIGLNTGWYYKKTINSKGEIASTSVDTAEAERVAYVLGDKVFIKEGEFEVDGFNYTTSHACSMEHLQQFITFLRNCGGFEIL